MPASMQGLAINIDANPGVRQLAVRIKLTVAGDCAIIVLDRAEAMRLALDLQDGIRRAFGAPL